MARDGSGIYSKPSGTTAVSSTTIESAKFNQVIDDIAADLNTARPIVAGGTGATSASAARTNLGATATGAALFTAADAAAGRTALGLASAVAAADYGFSTAGTAAANKTALDAAIAAAEGRQVIVDAGDDFSCDAVTVTGDLDILFTGTGRWNCTANGARAIIHQVAFEDALAISAFATETQTIDDNTVDVVSITVSDTTGYAVGDVVKIVSDDQFTLNDSVTAMRGEFATVVAVDATHIWVGAPLRDTYTTTPRIGRMQKKVARIAGLKILGSTDNVTSGLITQSGLWHPVVENFELHGGHGRIVINAKSCFGAQYTDLRATDKILADSSGSLGYLLNDSGSEGTIVTRPIAYWARHVTTTNHPDTAGAADPIQNYGPCRFHTVVDGFAWGCMGAPWDDHEGSIGSRWVNCRAVRGMNNASAATAAFQLRGVNSEVIDGYCDASYEHFARLNNQSDGTHRIVNATSYARDALSCECAGGSTPEVIWIGGYAEYADTVGLIDIEGATVRLVGGVFRMTGLATSDRRMIDIREGATLVMDNPVFEMSGTSTGNRIFNVFGTTGVMNIQGTARLRWDAGVEFTGIFVNSSSGGTQRARVDLLVEQGTTPNIVSGAWEVIEYNLRHLTDEAEHRIKVATPQATTRTISTGEITVFATYHRIDTEAAAATDDLVTINGDVSGQWLILRPVSGTRDVVLRHGAGNINCQGADITLGNVNDTVTLLYDGSTWHVTSARIS